MKKLLAALLALVMMLSLVACGNPGGSNSEQPSGDQTVTDQTPSQDGETPEYKGTIMWLSNVSSGRAFEVPKKMIEYFCEQLGYDCTFVYGDSYNDPAGNLNAVKNGMTKDVVALIASQDGGIINIMNEYPDLYVVGYNCDMDSVYDEDGASHAVLENDKWLGTICDGNWDGAMRAQQLFDQAVAMGLRKVSLVAFPPYAYPKHTVGAKTFIALAEEYNKTAAADDQFEIVGDIKVLEFRPLEESYFLNEECGDLDAIVAFCSGVQFVYPTMKAAMAAGTCSADTKLLTGGFDDNEEILADIGDGGVIAYDTFTCNEYVLYPLILIDNAVNGVMYADFSADRVVPRSFEIDSQEDVTNVMTKSFAGTGDISLMQWDWEDVLQSLTRNNPDATYADLMAQVNDDRMTTEYLKQR